MSNLAGLRVALLIESDGPGGAERVVADLAMELQACGAQSVVFVPAAGEGWLERQLAGSRVAIEHFRLVQPVSPASARSLTAAFRRHRITIAHSHEFSMAVYGAWASWHAGIPHVITMHGGRYYAARLRRRIALRAAISLSDRTLAVSRDLAAQISRDLWLPHRRISTILNGVRPAVRPRTTIREELRLGPDVRLLVSVGNLYPVKGHSCLLDAMALLSGRHPHLHLAIAGRGDLAETLTAHARSLGLASRVHLLGLRSDVAAVLAAADVFVLPSLAEGLPLALLEAMFAGCPIVASGVGEVGRALADGEAGLLVEPGNATALAAALDDVLSSPARAAQLGTRAARRAATTYDISQMVAQYGGIYGELTRTRLSVAHVAVTHTPQSG
jgi:glycosyltransferase involved in cell wall biosynthesis